MSGAQPYTIGILRRQRTDGSKYWSYCIKWWQDGGRRRLSLGTCDKVAAEAAARRFWAQRASGQVADTVGDVMSAYLDSQPKGEARKRVAWKAAKPYWGALRVSEIDEQVSRDYPGWRKRATNTIRNELNAIRTGCNWAAKPDEAGNSLIDKAPTIVVPSIPDSKVEHLTKAQFRTFLDGCSAPHVRLFAMLAVTTGARKGALLELKWDQVDLDRGIVVLNPFEREQVSNKGRATVPLNDRILPALREALAAALTDYVIEHNGSNIADIKKGILAASVRSGIHCHPHMLRHSAAVWMAEDRVPMEEIATFLGHKDARVTARVYARFNPDYLRRAARSLDW